MQEARKTSFILSVRDWRGERCGFTSAAQKDVPLLAGETLEGGGCRSRSSARLWDGKCMTWRDLDSFLGKNLLVLKCHPSHDVDFNGELLVKVACKLYLKPRDSADPGGFGSVTEHGAETLQQPHGCGLGARDPVLLTHGSSVGWEVFLSCLQEGLGAEPGLSDIITTVLWIDARASIVTGSFGGTVGALLWG